MMTNANYVGMFLAWGALCCVTTWAITFYVVRIKGIDKQRAAVENTRNTEREYYEPRLASYDKHVAELLGKLAAANRTIARHGRADKLSAAMSSNIAACPFCHCDTDDVTFGDIAAHNDVMAQHARCGGCGEEWRLVYKLSEIEEVDRGGQS